MKRWLFPITLIALLLAPFTSHAQGQEIEIPSAPVPTLDGEIVPGEWLAELPSDDLPLRAWAIHDGKSVYLAFQVLSPADEWETFAVWDDGDGVFYEAGDSMILCSADGCRPCEYDAELAFTCADEFYPSGVSGYSVEATWDVALAAGEMVIGGVLDGVEHVSRPFDVTFVTLDLTVEEPTSTPESQPIAATEEPSEEGAPAAGEEAAREEDGLSPLWILSAATLLAFLAAAIARAIWRIVREWLKRKAIREIEGMHKWLKQHREQREAALRNMKADGARGSGVEKMEQEVGKLSEACKSMEDILKEAKKDASACKLAETQQGADKAARVLQELGLLGAYAVSSGQNAAHVAQGAAEETEAAEREARDAANSANTWAGRADAASGAGYATAAQQAAGKAEEAAQKAEGAASKAGQKAGKARQAAEEAEKAAQRAEQAASGEKDPKKARAAQKEAETARQEAQKARRQAERAGTAARNAQTHANNARAAAQRVRGG
jgi:hypothetical protein